MSNEGDNMVTNKLHELYHILEELVAKVLGENARYRLIFFLRTGKRLKLSNPIDLNEKLFWLSRYWRNPLITLCSDKCSVREYVANKGCGDILNDQYGVYDTADQIDFDKLPSKFVLKCNHGSRMNIIVEDKEKLNIPETIKTLNKWVHFQYGRGTEWQYKYIKPQILVEKYLESSDGKMIEYQIFCFNGKPMFFLVRNDLRKSSVDKQSLEYAVSYTIDWQRVYMRKNEEQFDFELSKPHNYEKMIEYAIRLSQDFPQVRVDYYEVDDKLVFGELTFSSSGSILSNYKKEYIKSLGKELQLPSKYNE